MPYIDLAYLETIYGAEEILQLTDREGINTHELSLVDAAINAAEATVNGFLSQKVVTPIAVPQDDLKKLCADITRFYLYDNAAPEHIEKNYKMAMQALRGFVSGKFFIQGVSELAGSRGAVVKKNHTRVFTEDTLAGY